MEKRVRLIDFFDYPEELFDGISELVIERFDFYDDQIRMTLSGYKSMEDDNSLDRFYLHLRDKLNLAIYIRFNDFDQSSCDFAIFERKMRRYVAVRFEESGCTGSAFVDNVGFDLAEGTIVIGCDQALEVMFDDDITKESFGITATGIFGTLLGLEHLNYVFNIGSEEEVQCHPNIDLFYDEAQEILDRQAKEHKDDPKDGEKDQAPKPSGDTWEEKAKSVKREAKKEYKYFNKGDVDNKIFGRVKKDTPLRNIDQIEMGEGLVNIQGDILIQDKFRLTKTGSSVIAKFNVLDKTGEIPCLGFLDPKDADIFEKRFEKGGYCGIQGSVDSVDGELGIKVSGGYEADRPKGRVDNAKEKRVELHCHTKMSENDAVSDAKDMINLAASFGHRACAVTDHGVVQAFPAVYEAMKKINKKKEEGQEKFKAILGCEGYLCDDGPTIVYGLPVAAEDYRHIGSFVTIDMKTTGSDPNVDTMSELVCSKYRLKGYKCKEIPFEGESDEDAMAFSKKDIDTSLWDPEEIPELLRDESIKIYELAKPKPIGVIENADLPVKTECLGEEFIPEKIVVEHVADFRATFEDKIYEGKGEPCESYFLMEELLGFMDQAYIAGTDIFTKLGFLRRAGFGLNVEDHKYYRQKFLMPAISVEDILKYTDTEGEISRSDDLLANCKNDADIVTRFLTGAETIDPNEINSRIGHVSDEDLKNRKVYPSRHIIFLVRNYAGLYNLYRMVSEGHINYFSYRPRVPKSRIRYYSNGIIIGGACEAGEIYRFVIDTYRQQGKDKEKTFEFLRNSDRMREILSLYDYVEIQPLCNNMFLTRQQPKPEDTHFVPLNSDDIRVLNELLVEIADAYKMPCCATTDSHFLEKEDGKYRKYLLMDQGFSDADMQSDLYFRTTDEMLAEFEYLGKKKAFEVVVTNTNKFADMIDFGLKPFPDGTYPPIIARAAADVRDIVYTRANKLYRHKGKLNDTVAARIEKELTSIFTNGFAIMYYIAYRLVKKSNNDGYIVGSRGSVGSSFVATMSGISEVNPLPPHYRCPKCNYVEFDNTGTYGSGFDMPVKQCPDCGVDMCKDGQDIPFETFLGFFGDKQPDIDLNFSGEYQPNAHKYVEFLFGTTHTFKAGTVGTFADKNAYAVARSACEKHNIPYTNAKLDYMSRGIMGVKRTTSQHPGGMVVVPKEMDVYEFTPIQCPANKITGDIITTHFDFRAMHDTILKLDILGHADPTVLKMLNELTGIDVTTIPIPDEKVMSLLSSTEALGFPPEATEAGAATLGLSELGTPMARGMIAETKPTRFYDLVQLMGLSHGTDVWTGNAQDLIKKGICDLNSVIGCRDSIMTTLIYWGVPNKDAFDIMENVRKGKVAKGECDKWEGWKQLMRENNVPDWYIESCQKIKYMFPKAHAAAYSISSLRVAWFKVYYPEEYYCAFFTIRGDEFDAAAMCKGPDVVKERRYELEEKKRTSNEARNNPKVKSEIALCEIVEEMYARGITFAPISLEESMGMRFVKKEKGVIIPPFNAINEISESMGLGIENARKDGPFKNREDFATRSGIGTSAVEKLVAYGGILDDLPESAQVDMFDMFGIGK